MTGASGGVQDPSALVRTVHVFAQAGRFDARRETVWAEMMGVRREKRKAIRKDLIVSVLRVIQNVINGDDQVSIMKVMKGASRRD